MTTSIKTVLRQDLRRVAINLARCAFPDLLKGIRSAYSLPVTTDLTLTYIDAEASFPDSFQLSIIDA